MELFMTCPNCDNLLDDAEVTVTTACVGKIAPDGTMKAERMDEELTAVSCPHCGAYLNMLVKAWDWEA